MKCPYCNLIDFPGMEFTYVHEHLVTCSKEYIDRITQDHLAHFRAYMGMAPYLPDPPLSVPEPTERRIKSRRINIGGRRRGEDRTLKFGTRNLHYPGYYYDSYNHIQKDRRDRQDRTKDDRRKNCGRRKS